MRKKHYACNLLVCSLVAASGNANALALARLTVAAGQTYDNAPSATVFTSGSEIDVLGTFNNRGRIDDKIQVFGIFNNYKSVTSDYFTISKAGSKAAQAGVFNNTATGILNIDDYLGIYAGQVENDGLINFIYRSPGTASYGISFGSLMGVTSQINNRGEIRVDTNLGCGGHGKINNWGTFKITANNEMLCQDSGSYGPLDFYQYEGQTVMNGKFNAGSTNILGGTLSGNGTISGVLNIGNAASISPGDRIGTLTIAGNFNFSNSSLLIELGGKAANLSDRLAVTGNASLSGTLNVILAKGFTPKAGDVFDIVPATAISGDFATTNLPALPNGLTWDIQTLANRVRLTVL